MELTVSQLRAFTLHAQDGDLGKIVDVLFEDESWNTRYFVVETGGWLSSRRVLISPIAIRGVDTGNRALTADLTRDQIAKSPSVDTDVPLSRQMPAHGRFGLL